MRCHSKNHDWMSEVSAIRCCRPGWRRELRNSEERQRGDATGGEVIADIATGLRFVWNFSKRRQIADMLQAGLEQHIIINDPDDAF